MLVETGDVLPQDSAKAGRCRLKPGATSAPVVKKCRQIGLHQDGFGEALLQAAQRQAVASANACLLEDVL